MLSLNVNNSVTLFPSPQVHRNIMAKEKEAAALTESAKMFEVSVPDYKQLRHCRKEVRHLKHLWDFVYVVTSSFEDWNTTPWKKINVEVTTPRTQRSVRQGEGSR